MATATLMRPVASVVVLLNRLSLGALFAYAGCFKIFKLGVETFVSGPYKQVTPSWLPAWFAVPYGYALPFVELTTGLLLILGLLSRLSATLMVLLLLSIMIATGVYDPQKPPFNPTVIFCTLALLLALIGPGRYSLDGLIAARKTSRKKP